MDKLNFSIVVITYNSSKYVEETLESIKNQTHKNLELIITDDCSQDNTVSLCQDWLKKNSSSFERIQLVTSTRNTGIPANCNRGVKAAKGDWIKLIAGDDILKSTAIKDYADYLHSKKYSQESPDVIFSRIASFAGDVTQAKEIYNRNISNYILFHPKISQKDQTKLYCRGQLIKIITMIFSKKMFDDVKGFDEQYKLREDRPFIYKILSMGYKLYFMNQLTFYYRQHSESIMGIKGTRKRALELKLEYVWAPQIKYRYPNLSWLERNLAKIHYKKDRKQFDVLKSDKELKFNLFVIKMLSNVVNYLDKLIRHVAIRKYKVRYKDSFSYNQIKNH